MISKSFSSRRFNCFQFPILACVVLVSTASAGPIFYPVESTPYDHQMFRVQPILAADDWQQTDNVPLAVVDQWMNKLRRIRYQYSKQWQTPLEVSVTQKADCKGKAMVLYEVMHELGATDVRFVIGRRRANDWLTHAWLEWETAHGSFVLDPTFNRRAVKMGREGRNRYIPLYAYQGSFRYRAFNPSMPAEMPPRVVASGRSNWRMRDLTGLE